MSTQASGSVVVAAGGGLTWLIPPDLLPGKIGNGLSTFGHPHLTSDGDLVITCGEDTDAFTFEDPVYPERWWVDAYAADGSQVWHWENPTIAGWYSRKINTVHARDGFVYVAVDFGYSSNVYYKGVYIYKLNAQTGEQIWGPIEVDKRGVQTYPTGVMVRGCGVHANAAGTLSVAYFQEGPTVGGLPVLKTLVHTYSTDGAHLTGPTDIGQTNPWDLNPQGDRFYARWWGTYPTKQIRRYYVDGTEDMTWTRWSEVAPYVFDWAGAGLECLYFNQNEVLLARTIASNLADTIWSIDFNAIEGGCQMQGIQELAGDLYVCAAQQAEPWPIRWMKIDRTTGSWDWVDEAWLEGGADQWGPAYGEMYEIALAGETPVALGDFWGPSFEDFAHRLGEDGWWNYGDWFFHALGGSVVTVTGSGR